MAGRLCGVIVTVELKKIIAVCESLNVTVEERKRPAFAPKDYSHDLSKLLGEESLARYPFLVSAVAVAVLVRRSAFCVQPHVLVSRYIWSGPGSSTVNGASVYACVPMQGTLALAVGSLSCLISVKELMNDPENMGAGLLEAAGLNEIMRLDAAAINALNLLPPAKKASGAGAKFSSLLAVVSQGCWSKCGTRVLKRWILQPLMSVAEIVQRQDMVDLFVKDPVLRDELKGIVVSACAVRRGLGTVAADVGVRMRMPSLPPRCCRFSVSCPDAGVRVPVVLLQRVPDMDALAARLQRRSASLLDLIRLYNLVQMLPNLVARLSVCGCCCCALVHFLPHAACWCCVSRVML